MSERSLIKFVLKDQFDATHAREDYLGSVLIVLGGDREGSKHTAVIARAILAELDKNPDAAALKDKLKWLPVADLRIVPSLLRWAVKAFLPSNPAEKVALDWSGVFHAAYQWKDSLANAMIFGKDGRLLYSNALAELSDEERDKMVAIIVEALRA